MCTKEEGLCCDRHTHVVLKLLQLVIYLFLCVCLSVCLLAYLFMESLGLGLEKP